MTNLISPFLTIWNVLFYHPVVNLIVALYKITGNNLGFAIIILTILIRLLLWPLMKSQIESVKKMQSMKSKVDALKTKHKGDKKVFQEEQLKLYKENGVNPAGSCLPLLIQLPFIWAVYDVIRVVSASNNAAHFNDILYWPWLQMSAHSVFNTSFLGINLAKDAASIGFKNIGAVIPYILLAVVVGILQYFASKVSTPTNIAHTTEVIEEIEEPRGKKKKKSNMAVANAAKVPEKKDTFDPEQFSTTLTTQMLFIFPIILIWISLGFSGSMPAGLSIYWAVQSLMLVLQTLILQGKLSWKMKQ